MFDNQNFKDLDEAINYIINNLSDSEKDVIRNADPMGAHFALDRWIKSEYVSNESLNLEGLVSKKVKESDPDFSEEQSHNIHPDDVAGIIIDELLKKLKK